MDSDDSRSGHRRQASNCNYQIPAKIYEYLRAGKPVLAFTDPAGDTAATLRRAGIDTVATLTCSAEIQSTLVNLVEAVRKGVAPVPNASFVSGCSRQARAGQLAILLDELTDS